MGTVKDDTIGGVNEFVRSQKKVPGDADFTLVQFDDVYEVLQSSVPIRDARELTNETYQPRNSTALLDAIGRTINSTGDRLGKMSESDRPEKVVFVVITDGHENASKEFNRSQIFDMIKHQREVYKWEFVFIGANQDAIDSGSQIAVLKTHSLSNASTPEALKATYDGLASNLRSYRVGVSMSMAWSDEQRKEQEKHGAFKATKK